MKQLQYTLIQALARGVHNDDLGVLALTLFDSLVCWQHFIEYIFPLRLGQRVGASIKHFVDVFIGVGVGVGIGVGVDVNEAMGTEFVSFLFNCFSFSDSRETVSYTHLTLPTSDLV